MKMTFEEINTLKYVKGFLQELGNKKITEINRREVRDKARRLLKHFPPDYVLDGLG